MGPTTDPGRDRLLRAFVVLFVVLLAGACVAFAATCALDKYHYRLRRLPRVFLWADTLSSCDVLLLAPPHGRDPEETASWSVRWRQVGIKLGTGSPFTHAAMVCRSPEDGSLWAWEITPQKGVTRTPIETFFRVKFARKYEIGWRKLLAPPSVRKDLDRRLWRTTEDLADAPYSMQFIEVWVERNSLVMGSTDRPPNSAAGLCRRGGERRNKAAASNQGYFCSSLLAMSLEELGVCDWHRARLPGYWPFPRDFGGVALDVATSFGYEWEPLKLLSQRGAPSDADR